MDSLSKAINVLQDILKYNKENNTRFETLEFKIDNDTFVAHMPENCLYSFTLKMNGENIKMAEGSTLCQGDGHCYKCGR